VVEFEPLFRGDNLRKSVLTGFRAFQSEQNGCGQIDFDDCSSAIDGDIAHGGEIIEIRISFVELIGLAIGQFEFFTLHFQFDLANLEFMDQAIVSRL